MRIDDGRNSLMIWGRIKEKSTSGWTDVVAWVIDGGEKEIARYRKSLGYLNGEDKLFTVSFLKNKKWEEAGRPLTVYITTEKRNPSPLCCF